MNMSLIYLDNNATTRVAPEVFEAMRPFFTDRWGNAASIHRFGADNRHAIDIARKQVADLLHAQRPSEILFTSGGTESNQLAIRGVLAATPEKKHLITSQVEHASVLALCKELEKTGWKVDILPVNSQGELDPDSVLKALRPDTALVTLMGANNETGVVFPIEKIAPLCAKAGVPLHVDATQVCGKLPLELSRTPIALLSLSSHKLHGPKGMGALYVRRGTPIKPIFFGGSQERGLRPGTENCAGIVGLGLAAELASTHLTAPSTLATLRDRMESAILTQFPFAKLNGSLHRLPNTSSIRFEGLDGEAICLLLSEQNVAASTGSACSAGSLEPSHVLTAMGLKNHAAKGTVRLSLSRETTPDAIDRFLQILPPIIERLQRQQNRTR